MTRVPGILRVFKPRPANAIPLLVDSPHSGTHYPKDFKHTCERAELERYEDRFVDKLIGDFADLGATVICAEIARSYVDLNRATSDMQYNQFRNVWQGEELHPNYAKRGIGVVWTMVNHENIYDHYPTAAEVQRRINTYYRPYYLALEHHAAGLKDIFGKFWHLNMHSMPSDMRPDIILGTLNGQSCSDEFANCIENAMRGQGLRVMKNIHYKGANLTYLFGKPHRQSESMQIEINKGLYLKDDLLTIDDRKFAVLKAALENVCKIAGNYALSELAASKTPANDTLRAASRSAMDARMPSAASDVTP